MNRLTKVFVLSAASCLCALPTAMAQAPNTIFRAESRLVLVDTVVMDKKGGYVTNLTQQDFRVSEDGKEQPIKTFGFSATPEGRPRQQYVLLFFDNRMQPADEVRSREAAAKLIAANNGPSKFFAVVNFGSVLRVTQNFTSDAELLLPAVQGKYLGLSGRLASLNADEVSQVEGDFSAASLLQGLRSLAKGMSKIPGRKSIIFLTTGFSISADRYFELQAAIDACNKANVAVYPLDVQGLTTGGKSADQTRLIVPPPPSTPRWSDGVFHPGEPATVKPASFTPEPQKNVGPGPGATSGGGPSGVRPGMLGTYIPDADRASIRRPPPPVADVTKNLANPHSVLYVLAESTGGFVILNTNDIVGGMQKITQEQSSYYMLGFVPTPAAEGSCHRLKVKVNRSGVEVRSRNTYCTVKPIDYLAGDPAEQQLEAQLDAAKADNAAVTITAPFFYTAANTARVNLILDIPSATMAPDASGGKFHRDYNVLGIAYKSDGSVAARFSDTIKLDLDKKEFEAFRAKPYHYEKQFPIASGEYTLKVAVAAGANVVARVDTALKVESYDSKRLSLSSVTLTKDLVDVTHNQELLDRAMVEDRTLLIFDGMQFVPSAMKKFKRTDTALMYMEVYEPMLVDNPAGVVGVNLRYRVLSLDTGATVMDTGLFAPKAPVRPGYPVVPVALRLLSDRLQPGSYRLVVQASNAGGQHSPERNVDFDVE